MSEEVTFKSLGEAIAFVDKKGEAMQNSVAGFQTSFKELTGFEPQRTVTALDVAKICFSLYGEPAKND